VDTAIVQTCTGFRGLTRLTAKGAARLTNLAVGPDDNFEVFDHWSLGLQVER